jgi:hypothetical protein
MITLSAAFMFFSSGGIIIETWYNAKNSTGGYLVGAGILAFVTGITYLGDFALTFFKYG